MQARLVGWNAKLEDARKQSTIRGLEAERSHLLENRTAARSHGDRSSAAEPKSTDDLEAESVARPEASWSPTRVIDEAAEFAPGWNLRDSLRSPSPMDPKPRPSRASALNGTVEPRSSAVELEARSRSRVGMSRIERRLQASAVTKKPRPSRTSVPLNQLSSSV
jgi:hypothetical protein